MQDRNLHTELDQPDLEDGQVIEMRQRRRARRTQGSLDPPPGRKPASQDLAVMASFSLIALLATGQAVDINVADPSWKTSIPAAISALAALATFTFTLMVWRGGAVDRVREQASKVYVSTHRTEHPDGSMTVQATVHNKSDAPIWDVVVQPLRDGSPYDAAPQTLPDILPARTQNWKWTVSSEEVPREDRYPELVFVDAAQRRWRRDGLKLTRIKSR